jgi:hypothetical protein
LDGLDSERPKKRTSSKSTCAHKEGGGHGKGPGGTHAEHGKR